jgi:hypothetical protein
LEINGAIACQFAIELKGNILLACNPQLASLKIFDLGGVNVGTEYNILEILDDFEIAEALEHDDIEESVIDAGILKEWEGSSVKTAVSDKNKGSFF